MSDNRRVGGKANDGKNGTRRRKYLRLKKKLREKARKEAGLKLVNKKTKSIIDKPKATPKKAITKKATTKKATTKKATTKKATPKKATSKKATTKKATTK